MTKLKLQTVYVPVENGPYKIGTSEEMMFNYPSSLKSVEKEEDVVIITKNELKTLLENIYGKIHIDTMTETEKGTIAKFLSFEDYFKNLFEDNTINK